MGKDKLPVTAAVRALRAAGVEFTDHPYTYEEHGGTEVCARELKVDEHSVVKTVTPCTPDAANRHTGYMVGGTSPFGTRRTMPVYMEETIPDLPRIYVNGGRRGYLVGMDPKDVVKILQPTLVRTGIS